MKTVLFVPGHGSSTLDATVRSIIEEKGYRLVVVSINWDGTIEEWSRQLEEAYSHYDPKETVLAGFSLGAVTVFVVAAKRPPAKLWLFSLSARFAEDIPNLSENALAYLGKERFAAFEQISFNEIAPKVNSETLLILGSKEYQKFPTLAVRVHKAEELLSNAHLVVARRSGHNLTHRGYRDAIAASI